MGPLGGSETQRAGDRLEHFERGPDVATLLEPRVPGGADPGELGLAVLSTLTSSETRSSVGVSPAQALTNGFGVAFRVGALFCVAGALVAAFGLRAAAKPETVTEVPRDEELEESEALAV